MGNNIISSLGGGSGINTQELVDNLVSVERAAPDARLDRQKERFEAQLSAYGTLKASLEEFQRVVDPLTNPDLFNARTGTLPTNNLLSAVELRPGAQTGTFNIKVDQLAQSQSLATQSVSNVNSQLVPAAAGDQTITINFGAWTYDATDTQTAFVQNASLDPLTIDIRAGQSSLTDIAQAINDQDSDLQASIVADGAGGSRLLLTAPSGEQQQLQIQTSHAGLSMFNFDVGSTPGASGLELTQRGQDAQLEMNGLALTRSSNTIDDVVQGFEFTLDSASATDTVSFTISEDKSTAEQAIRDFVEAYNTFAETADNLVDVAEDEETGRETPGALSTDGTAKSLVRNLLDVKSEAIEGVDALFSRLSSIGIVSRQTGGLEFNTDSNDEEIFQKALAQDFDKVRDLFARSTGSSTSLIEVQTFSSRTPPDGVYEVEVTQDPIQASLRFGHRPASPGFPITMADPSTLQLNFGSGHAPVYGLSNLTFNSGEELASHLSGLINADEEAVSRTGGVAVNYDAALGLTFTANDYGSGASIQYGNFLGGMRDLFQTLPDGVTAGVDAAGTINGEVAEVYGGNQLAPRFASQYNGLLLTLETGSVGTHTVNFSTGFAGNLVSDIANILADDGTIATREETLNNDIEGVDTDREELDARMERTRLRYQSQFLEMERVLAGLNDAQAQLDNLLNVLFPPQQR